MSDLIGSGVKDPNFVYRILIILVMGVLAFGAILYWRVQLYLAASYQDLPVTHKQIKIINQNKLIKKEFYGDN